MKNLSIILGLLFITTVSADGHMQSEKDVLSALNKYFDSLKRSRLCHCCCFNELRLDRLILTRMEASTNLIML